jgi:pimeloyl-ACP methyl ester carboxylesterase
VASDAAGKTYVLVHGAFHGAWCWKDVAGRLRRLGHDVYTPTLTGLGERSHLLACNPGMDTFIQDVSQVLRFEDLTDVILVGHSFAGAVISGVADRMAERLRHLVYLDAMILQSGQSATDTAPADLMARYRQEAQETSGGLSVPPNTPAYYGITDPAQARWLEARLTPHPFRTYSDRLVLQNPLGNGVPATYIACTQPLHRSTASARMLAQAMPGWTYREIPTAHNAMMLQPDELTRMLTAIG